MWRYVPDRRMFRERFFKNKNLYGRRVRQCLQSCRTLCLWRSSITDAFGLGAQNSHSARGLSAGSLYRIIRQKLFALDAKNLLG